MSKSDVLGCFTSAISPVDPSGLSEPRSSFQVSTQGAGNMASVLRRQADLAKGSGSPAYHWATLESGDVFVAELRTVRGLRGLPGPTPGGPNPNGLPRSSRS